MSQRAKQKRFGVLTQQDIWANVHETRESL